VQSQDFDLSGKYLASKAWFSAQISHSHESDAERECQLHDGELDPHLKNSVDAQNLSSSVPPRKKSETKELKQQAEYAKKIRHPTKEEKEIIKLWKVLSPGLTTLSNRDFSIPPRIIHGAT